MDGRERDGEHGGGGGGGEEGGWIRRGTLKGSEGGSGCGGRGK